MKRMDSIVWNKTEELLRPAEADVLEIFDWQVPPFTITRHSLTYPKAAMQETWDLPEENIGQSKSLK